MTGHSREKTAACPETEPEWTALIHRIAEGDEVAFQSLYEHTHRLVTTVAFRIVDNLETAEEVAMDVFLKVWFQASRYDPERGTVIGWIMSLARSKGIDRLRFTQRMKRRSHEHNGILTETVAPCDAENSLHLTERRLLLERALACLSAKDRKIIEAAYLLELTHQQVAVKTGMPLGTIKTRIRIALGKLRTTIASGKDVARKKRAA